MGTSEASEPLIFFIVVIYELSPTYSFLLPFPDCSFGNGHIDHITDLLNDIIDVTYWQYVIKLAKNLNKHIIIGLLCKSWDKNIFTHFV